MYQFRLSIQPASFRGLPRLSAFLLCIDFVYHLIEHGKYFYRSKNKSIDVCEAILNAISPLLAILDMTKSNLCAPEQGADTANL